MDKENPRPSKLPGVRLCLAVTKNGVTAYANSEAFRSIAESMRWLEKSRPEDHFECHLTMALESDDSLFSEKRPRNVWALLSHGLESVFPKRSKTNPGFEVTFMMVTEKELDDLALRQSSGLLASDWESTDERHEPD